MHRLREAQVEQGLRPRSERLAWKAWAWLAVRPRLYRTLSRLASRYLRWLGGPEGWIQVLGMAPGWTEGRDLRVARGATFHEQYAARRAARK